MRLSTRRARPGEIARCSLTLCCRVTESPNSDILLSLVCCCSQGEMLQRLNRKQNICKRARMTLSNLFSHSRRTSKMNATSTPTWSILWRAISWLFSPPLRDRSSKCTPMGLLPYLWLLSFGNFGLHHNGSVTEKLFHNKLRRELAINPGIERMRRNIRSAPEQVKLLVSLHRVIISPLLKIELGLLCIRRITKIKAPNLFPTPRS